MFIVRKMNLNRQKKTLLKDKEGTFTHLAKVKIPIEITSTAKLSRNLVNGRVRNNQNHHIPPGVYTISIELLSVANEKAWNMLYNK